MSDKPVAERLQVKGDRRLAVVGAPAGLDGVVGAHEARAAVAEADVVLLFAKDRASLEAGLRDLLGRIRSTSILWVAYPKLTSRLAGDLSREIVHKAAPAYALKTVSQIAVDQDWSALRLKPVG